MKVEGKKKYSTQMTLHTYVSLCLIKSIHIQTIKTSPHFSKQNLQNYSVCVYICVCFQISVCVPTREKNRGKERNESNKARKIECAGEGERGR